MVFRRSRQKIFSEKKETTWSLIGQNFSSQQENTVYEGVPVADVNLGTEIAVGQIVKWVYVEFNLSAEAITTTTIYHWVLEYVPEGMTVGAPNTYNSGDKSYIIKRGMEMVPKNVSTIIKRIFVAKIPKAYQRVKVNTHLKLRLISSSTSTGNWCGFTICKPQT